MNFFIIKKNLLNARGNVEVLDLNKNIEIYANKISYEKNKEIITANNNVKVLDLNKNIEIYANKISYEKIRK